MLRGHGQTREVCTIVIRPGGNTGIIGSRATILCTVYRSGVSSIGYLGAEIAKTTKFRGAE